MIRYIRLILIALIMTGMLLSTAACQAILPAPRFDLAFSTPENEPVFIEEATYDDTWIGRGGIMFCCWERAGAVNVISPRPVPKKIFIRWFNYKQQKFYEATAFLPENTEATMRRLPKPRFGDAIITTGVLPNGEVVVWVSNGLSERTGTWVEVARVQGHQAEGNPGDYKSQTEEMRERGEI